MVVFPGAGYMEMGLAAGREILSIAQPCIENVTVQQPLVLNLESETTVQVIVSPTGQMRASFTVASLNSKTNVEEKPVWTIHATGEVTQSSAPQQTKPGDLREVADSVPASGAEKYYKELAGLGLDYGFYFQLVEKIWFEDALSGGELKISEDQLSQYGYVVHPCSLDGCFHILAAAIARHRTNEVFLPLGMERLSVYQPACPSQRLWCYSVNRPKNSELVRGDVRVFDSFGHLVLEVTGLELKRAPVEALRHAVFGRPRWESWLYSIQWKKGSIKNADPIADNWLAFVDSGGVGDALSTELQSVVQRFVQVRRSCGPFRRNDENSFEIREGCIEDYRQLVDELLKAGERWQIVYLWSLDASIENLGDKTPVSEVTRALQGALFLVQALKGFEASVLWITRGAQTISRQTTRISVVQAPMTGFLRMVTKEEPHLRSVHIDIDPKVALRSSAASLIAEAGTSGDEDEIVYVGNSRYLPRLSPIRRSTDSTVSRQTFQVHEDGVYLITGGLGALGLRLAQWLVEQGAKHLALASRRELASAARQLIETIEAQGASVSVHRTDVGQHEDVTSLFANLRNQDQELRGIFHLAGILDDGMLHEQTWPRFERVLSPKVDGAWNLHWHCRDLNLDCFVLFSSVASVQGGAPGQSNYAAANSFLDALAFHRRELGLPAISINWGGWRGQGMIGTLRESILQQFQQAGIEWIDPKVGFEVLANLLTDRQLHQAIVIPVDWSAYTQIMNPTVPSLLADLVKEQQRSSRPTTAMGKRLKGLAERDRKKSVRDSIVGVVRDVLGFSEEEPIDCSLPTDGDGV